MRMEGLSGSRDSGVVNHRNPDFCDWLGWGWREGGRAWNHRNPVNDLELEGGAGQGWLPDVGGWNFRGCLAGLG